MKATGRWIVVSIATVLLIGAVWYALHSASPREAASIPAGQSVIAPHPFAAARPSSIEGKRGAINGDGSIAFLRYEYYESQVVIAGLRQ
jgi:hypothetical protein